MSGKKRGLRTALGACAVMAASAGLAGVGASPASADYQQSDPNPLSTNVPYLAWRGEHVRLVKCEADLPGSDMETLKSSARSDGRLNVSLHVNTDVLVEDWSGLADFKPQVASGTVDLFYSPYKGLCVKADVISQKAGLAMIKMMATLDPGNDAGLVDIITRSEILAAHQFLVGWMNLGTPTLTELPVGGDAANLNNFNASNDPSKDGVLRATLNGNLPLGNNFSELGLGDTLTLPDGWAALANALASDRNPDNAPHVGTQYRWDIHDSTTDEEGHPLQDYGCRDHVPFDLDPVGPFGDAVDNCRGGLSFSRVFDASGQSGNLGKFALPNTSGGTIGPFDPQRADETYLGDGRLNADDAPMPAARLDVSIAAGGIGSLINNDKQTFFSRDRAATANAGSGDPSKKHNLYAPFYDAYIPATADGSFLLFGTPVSGTDGPSTGNNFPGYLADSPYHFWDIAHVLSNAYAQPTHCLNRLVNGYPQYRSTPSGAQSVVVYTDEHGMAQVNYRAGTGANYDALGDRDNANGGCDLKGVDVLGRANVSAEARYPYQPTTDIAPRVSPVVTKVVHSLFSKELTVWPKGSSADLRNTRIVVAHAQDVDGSPYANEKVCFLKSTAEGQIRPYVYNGVNARFVGGYDLAGASSVAQTLDNTVCMITNSAGNAAIEVTQSTGQVVDITGDFTDEGLLREKHINFAQPIPADQQQPVGPGPIGDDSTPPAAGPVPNPVVPLPGNPAPVSAGGQQMAAAVAAALGTKAPAKVNSKLATVRFAHLVSAKGSRYLVIRLNGKATAKVRIKLFNKKGKAITMVEKKIAAGKSVKISGLKFTKDVTRVSVKVIG
jgi:hypothetical protein